MAEQFPGVHSDPEILGGTPVFVGTRVPVRALFDYLEHDRPLAEFRDDFPIVDLRGFAYSRDVRSQSDKIAGYVVFAPSRAKIGSVSHAVTRR